MVVEVRFENAEKLVFPMNLAEILLSLEAPPHLIHFTQLSNFVREKFIVPLNLVTWLLVIFRYSSAGSDVNQVLREPHPKLLASDVSSPG